MKARIFTIVFFLSLLTEVYSLEYWVQTNGPYGGNILCIAGRSTGEIFCGTPYSGGIFTSSDNGNTWLKRTYAYAFDGIVKALCVDRNDNIYASIFGVMRSSNNGYTWIQIASFLAPNSITVNSSGHVFAGGSDGKLYRTTNAGANWDIVLSAINSISTVIAANNGNIYVSDKYVRISTDNGNSWPVISTSAILPGIDMAVDSSGSILLSNYTGIYKTTNNGLSWSLVYSGSASTAIGVAAGNIYYAGILEGKIIRSTDNGLSWAEVYNPNTIEGPSINDIYLKQSGSVFVCTSAGMVRTTNAGTTWERTNTGITNTHINSICFDGNSKLYAGLSGDGIYTTTNAGVNWIRSGLEFKNVNTIGINGFNNIFANTSDTAYATYRSTNGGLSWSRANTGLTNTGFIFKYKSINGNVYAASDFGLFRSMNNGDSWIPSLTTEGPIRYFDVNSSNEIFAGSLSTIYKSTDYGVNWTVLVHPFQTINDFVISQTNGYMFYIKYSSLYRSTDNGLSWIWMNSMYVDKIFCGPQNSMFGYYHDSVFKSIDYGVSWQRDNSGLLLSDGVVMAYDQNDYAYIGTGGASVFKTYSPVISVQNISGTIPSAYSLSQNYPNPFNPVTNIKFQIPGESIVKMTVYDILGKEITSLVNENLQPGEYSVTWDASNYPSGVYLYKISAGDPSLRSGQGFTETKKMVLIK